MEGLKMFLHPENHSKISNLMITALFYSHILNRETCLNGFNVKNIYYT